MTPSSPDLAPEPSAVENLEETFRRRLLSISAFVEIAHAMHPGDSLERLYRQALFSAIGTTDAPAGAVFAMEKPGQAQLLEVFGAWEGSRPGAAIALPPLLARA